MSAPTKSGLPFSKNRFGMRRLNRERVEKSEKREADLSRRKKDEYNASGSRIVRRDSGNQNPKQVLDFMLRDQAVQPQVAGWRNGRRIMPFKDFKPDMVALGRTDMRDLWGVSLDVDLWGERHRMGADSPHAPEALKKRISSEIDSRLAATRGQEYSDYQKRLKATEAVTINNWDSEEMQQTQFVHGLTAGEVMAVKNYTNANSNDNMIATFGEYNRRQDVGTLLNEVKSNNRYSGLQNRDDLALKEGWSVFSRAIAKMPTVGMMGRETATFRVVRTPEEMEKMKELPIGSVIKHGHTTLSHGQGHYMPTALSHSVFTVDKKIQEAGGAIRIIGNSGRYVSHVGIQSASVDGGEVLYPPGTYSKLVGKDIDADTGMQLFTLQEVSTPKAGDGQTIYEDFGYTQIHIEAPVIRPIPVDKIKRD